MVRDAAVTSSISARPRRGTQRACARTLDADELGGSEVGNAMAWEANGDADTERKCSLAVCKVREGIRRGGNICEVFLESGMMRP